MIVAGTIVVTLLWGISPHLYKRVSQGYTSPDFIVLSGLSYSLLILMLFCWRTHRLRRTFEVTHIPRIFFFALLFIFIPNIIYVWAIQKSDRIDRVTSITYISPLVTAMSGYLLFGNSLSKRQMLGAMMLIVGAVLAGGY